MVMWWCVSELVYLVSLVSVQCRYTSTDSVLSYCKHVLFCLVIVGLNHTRVVPPS